MCNMGYECSVKVRWDLGLSSRKDKIGNSNIKNDIIFKVETGGFDDKPLTQMM